jgi:hypothetical protein
VLLDCRFVGFPPARSRPAAAPGLNPGWADGFLRFAVRFSGEGILAGSISRILGVAAAPVLYHGGDFFRLPQGIWEDRRCAAATERYSYLEQPEWDSRCRRAFQISGCGVICRIWWISRRNCMDWSCSPIFFFAF